MQYTVLLSFTTSQHLMLQSNTTFNLLVLVSMRIGPGLSSPLILLNVVFKWSTQRLYTTRHNLIKYGGLFVTMYILCSTVLCISDFKGATSLIYRVNRLKRSVHLKVYLAQQKPSRPARLPWVIKRTPWRMSFEPFPANHSVERGERPCLNALRKQTTSQPI